MFHDTVSVALWPGCTGPFWETRKLLFTGNKWLKTLIAISHGHTIFVLISLQQTKLNSTPNPWYKSMSQNGSYCSRQYAYAGLVIVLSTSWSITETLGMTFYRVLKMCACIHPHRQQATLSFIKMYKYIHSSESVKTSSHAGKSSFN